MTPALQFGLTFLVFTTVLVIVIIGAFVIKLVIDLSKLTTNLDETTTLIKYEIEPTLKELKETLQNLNSITQSADKQVDNAKQIISTIINTTGTLLSQMKNFSGSLAKGILAGFKLFSKK